MLSADQKFIQLTLKLAKKGTGHTLPNPMVGAVLVKNDKIIGQGYHKKFGSDHAEVMAIKSTTRNLYGATLYVNLEPCNHHGKTPPCTDLIIKSGIKKVVCSSLDPNPKVHGQGIKKLKKAGIEVILGILEKEAILLNEAFFTTYQKNRPFIALKFAASLDGKIATRTGDSKWITNDRARTYTRKLRSEYQAILIGINTVLADNPHLGSRIKNGHDPLRIILDSKLRIPIKSDVLRDKNVLVITTKKADPEKEKKLLRIGIDIIKLESDIIEVKKLLKELVKRNIISILVEGGGSILGSFVDEGLIDKMYTFHAPIIIGGKDAVSAIEGKGIEKVNQAIKFSQISHKHFGDNLLTIVRV